MLTPAHAKLICSCTHYCAVMHLLLNAFYGSFPCVFCLLMVTPCLPMPSAKYLKSKLFSSTGPHTAKAALNWPIFRIIRPFVWISANKEYQMLELLCPRSGRIVSTETFLDHLYGGIDGPEIKIMDFFICKLRKKISREIQDAALIETVWGRGYRVNAEAVA